MGIPGSGLYDTSSEGLHSGVHSAHVEAPTSPRQQRVAHWGCGAMVVAVLAAIGGLVVLLVALAAMAAGLR